VNSRSLKSLGRLNTKKKEENLEVSKGGGSLLCREEEIGVGLQEAQRNTVIAICGAPM